MSADPPDGPQQPQPSISSNSSTSPFGPAVGSNFDMGGGDTLPSAPHGPTPDVKSVQRAVAPGQSGVDGLPSSVVSADHSSVPQQPLPLSAYAEATPTMASAMDSGSPPPHHDVVRVPDILKDKKVHINRGPVYVSQGSQGLQKKSLPSSDLKPLASGSSHTIYAPPPGRPPPPHVRPGPHVGAAVKAPKSTQHPVATQVKPSVRVEEVPSDTPKHFRAPELVGVETIGNDGSLYAVRESPPASAAMFGTYMSERFSVNQGDPAAHLTTYGQEEPRGPGVTLETLHNGGVHEHPCYRLNGHYFEDSNIFMMFNADASLEGQAMTVPTTAGSGLYRRDWRRENAEHGDGLDYYFCPTCCVWIRVFAGTLNRDEFQSMLGKLKWLSVVTVPEAERFEAIVEERDRAETLDPNHGCHYHKIDNVGTWTIPDATFALPNHVSSMLESERAATIADTISDLPRTVHLCCGCDAVIITDYPGYPSCIPKRIVDDLIFRGDARKPGSGKKHAVEALYMAWTLLQISVVDRAEDKLDIHPDQDPVDRLEVDSNIGSDPLGQEILRRLGYCQVGPQEGPDSAEKSWSWRPVADLELEIKEDTRDQDQLFLTRAFFEIQLIAEALSEELGDDHDWVSPLSEFWNHSKWVSELKVDLADLLPRPLKAQRARHHVVDILTSKAEAGAAQVLGLDENDQLDALGAQWLAQTRCDPRNTARYTTAYKHLMSVVGALFGNQEGVAGPNSIEQMIMIHTLVPDVEKFQSALLTLALDEAEIDQGGATLVSRTVREQLRAMKKVEGLTTEVVAAQQNCFLDAVKVIALARQDATIMNVWRRLEQEVNGLAQAYTFLRSSLIPDPEQLDEDMWVAMFVVQQSDASKPTSDYFLHWVEPYQVIARNRGFKKLLEATGVKEEEETTPPDETTPPGLYNIGNTCYLNSLLQYLYSVRPLREAVIIASGKADARCAESRSTEPLRIGGRLVSFGEIERSIKFMQQLANLFRAMDDSTLPAIRPERDLAYMALVTASADQTDPMVTSTTQVAEPEQMSTDLGEDADSPTPTDATLVETPVEGGTPRPIDDALASDGVEQRLLGKRTGREEDDAGEETREKGLASISATIENALPTRDIKPLPGRLGSETVPDNGDLPLDATMDIAPASVDMDVAMTGTGPSVQADAPPSQPPPPDHRGSMAGPMMFGQQNDVSETLDNCLFQIEAALTSIERETGARRDPSDTGGLVQSLFYGRAKQHVFTQGPDGTAQRQPATDVILNNILLSVEKKDNGDIYDKLHDIYFTRDKIELDGKEAEKAEVLVTCPPVLNLQLQRVLYDRETARAFKSNAAIKYSETIYLDRFMESADDLKRETSEAMAGEIAGLRQTLRGLEISEPLPLADNLGGLSDALLATGLTFETPADDLKAEGERVGEAVRRCVDGIEEDRKLIESLWEPHKEHEYELSAVFMHRGQAGYGHYWLYQRDLPTQPDRWFQFNDETVRIVPKSEVFKFIDGDTASAYLVVYVRKGDQSYIETAVSRNRRLVKEAWEVARARASPSADVQQIPLPAPPSPPQPTQGRARQSQRAAGSASEVERQK